MSDKKPVHCSWPWSHFPEDGSTWATCVAQHQALQDRVDELEETIRRLVPDAEHIVSQEN